MVLFFEAFYNPLKTLQTSINSLSTTETIPYQAKDNDYPVWSFHRENKTLWASQKNLHHLPANQILENTQPGFGAFIVICQRGYLPKRQKIPLGKYTS